MRNSTPIVRRTNAELVRTLSAFGMSECNVGACLSFLDSTEEQRCEASGYPAPGFEIRGGRSGRPAARSPPAFPARSTCAGTW